MCTFNWLLDHNSVADYIGNKLLPNAALTLLQLLFDAVAKRSVTLVTVKKPIEKYVSAENTRANPMACVILPSRIHALALLASACT